jgi:hypothetical protein
MITKDATRLQDTPDIGLEPFKEHFCQLGLIRGGDYDQERMNIEYHLRFDGHKVYQEADLGDERILDRALRLLYRARFGQGGQKRANIRTRQVLSTARENEGRARAGGTVCVKLAVSAKI